MDAIAAAAPPGKPEVFHSWKKSRRTFSTAS